MVPRLGARDELPVQCARLGIGLSLDPVSGRKVDLDLQAVAFDTSLMLQDVKKKKKKEKDFVCGAVCVRERALAFEGRHFVGRFF
jgi:hypothetical protein